MGASYTFLRFMCFHGEPVGGSKVASGGHSCGIVGLRGNRGSVTLPALRGQSCGLVSSRSAVGGRGRQWESSLRYRERMLHNKVRD